MQARKTVQGKIVEYNTCPKNTCPANKTCPETCQGKLLVCAGLYKKISESAIQPLSCQRSEKNSLGRLPNIKE